MPKIPSYPLPDGTNFWGDRYNELLTQMDNNGVYTDEANDFQEDCTFEKGVYQKSYDGLSNFRTWMTDSGIRYNTCYGVDYAIDNYVAWGDPVVDDREATLSLSRSNTAETNSEFIDIFNNGYHGVGDVVHGLAIQKRGTGQYRDFVFRTYDGVTKKTLMTIDPNEEVIIIPKGRVQVNQAITISTSGTQYWKLGNLAKALGHTAGFKVMGFAGLTIDFETVINAYSGISTYQKRVISSGDYYGGVGKLGYVDNGSDLDIYYWNFAIGVQDVIIEASGLLEPSLEVFSSAPAGFTAIGNDFLVSY